MVSLPECRVGDVINVGDSAIISGLRIGVDITHPFRGDLRVTLSTPWGIVVELQPKGRGGNSDDLKVTFDEAALPALATLRGQNAQGTWKLTVQDLGPSDIGKLNRWWLEISTAPPAVLTVDMQEQPAWHYNS
jgi:subtilisin-like proprotein convertase family protein